MEKVRIGFLLPLTDGWLGGVNYYRNLLNILSRNPEFDLVGIIPKHMNKTLLHGFPKIEYVRTVALDSCGWGFFLRRCIHKFFRYDYMLKYAVNKAHIQVLSHVQEPCNFKGIKQIGWIPDFQHKHLPNFFSREEVIARDKGFEKLAKVCDCVILSSQDAKKDFTEYMSSYAQKAKVLSFVVLVNRDVSCSEEELLEYDIPEKFFYIPNQFWVHKNHRLVLEALLLLHNRGIDITVICTGNTEDYRSVDHYRKLQNFVQENQLQRNFRVLGKVPYSVVVGLMIRCKALLNPSLFEGWNTMVEEAKTLGKQIILSDLPVHKEQNPRGGVFFKSGSIDDLACKMERVWNQANGCFENQLQCEAELNSKKREDKLLVEYRRIIKKMLELVEK